MSRASIRLVRSFLGLTVDESKTREMLLFHSRHMEFKDNEVTTSRYNVFTFIPLNLLVQFTKPANMYFLLIAILQSIPSISLSGAIPTVAIPLTIVVIANMIKDGVEDRKRHVSDKKENSQTVLVIDPATGEQAERVWKNIRVGDMVALQNNGPCPSDIVVIATSESSGVSFVETSNLDGETNLKLRTVPIGIELFGANGVKTAKEAAYTLSSHLKNAKLTCQLPNKALYEFEGSVRLDGGSKDIESGEIRIPLSNQNVILRGCRLRNTEWVLGVVVYTGHETKIQMNSRKAPRKLSSFEALMSKFIWYAFWIQSVLCIVGATVWGLIASSDKYQGELYLGLSGLTTSQIAGKSVLKFFSYIILFSNFIPISLMVTLAVVKLFQSHLIQADEYMDKSTVVRTSDLNEELGQIEYVFSDKTGTLTRNRMEFRKACISGISYGQGLTEIRRSVLKKLGEIVPPEPKNSDCKTPNVNFIDSRLENIFATKEPRNHYNDLAMFFFSLAVNHSVMIEASNTEVYAASSPDESALTYGARHFGFKFIARTPQGVTIRIGDREIFVEQLASFDFNSVRKRSTLLCRCPDPTSEGGKETKVFLFVKGADSVIIPRLSESCTSRIETQQTLDEMEAYALDGLRTLCIGYREISEDKIKDWLPRFSSACNAMIDREEKLVKLAEELETDIELLGVTAIEDKLQADVGSTIESLRNAGMKVWMLTGDKLETAINIGLATSLLNASGMYRVILGRVCGGDMKLALDQTKAEFESILGGSQRPLEAEGASEVALVVTGNDLEIIWKNDELKSLFGKVAVLCASVICCRVSPEQKASVVRLVREEHKKITLCIGDGANDCNMIQSANVGVGIKGVEGMQAFNASDYGITEFRFLAPLLLVHGRWAYRRIAKLVLYIFYKNVVIVLPSYFLNILVSLFSGQRLFEEYMYQLYNVFFTAAPVVVYGIFERDISKKDCLEFPQLYKVGPDRMHARKRTFFQWLLTSLWHSVCIFFIPYFAMTQTQIINSDGVPSDIWLFGMYVYLSIVVVVNTKLLLETYFLNALLIAISVGSTILWFVTLQILQAFPLFNFSSNQPKNVNLSSPLAGVPKRLYSSPMTFIIIFATCVAALSRDFIFKAYRFRFRSRDYHVVMASEKRPVDSVVVKMARKRLQDLSVFTESDPIASKVSHYS
jgi:phospholipid-transporting ATPase